MESPAGNDVWFPSLPNTYYIYCTVYTTMQLWHIGCEFYFSLVLMMCMCVYMCIYYILYRAAKVYFVLFCCSALLTPVRGTYTAGLLWCHSHTYSHMHTIHPCIRKRVSLPPYYILARCEMSETTTWHTDGGSGRWRRRRNQQAPAFPSLSISSSFLPGPKRF